MTKVSCHLKTLLEYFPRAVLEILTNSIEVDNVWFGLMGSLCCCLPQIQMVGSMVSSILLDVGRFHVEALGRKGAWRLEG